MNRYAFLAGFGVVCLLSFLIAGMPARLMFDLALKSSGVEAGQVQGRVWDAQMLRIRAGDLSIAEARAQLAPMSLLTLNARFDVTLLDPALRGDGIATFSSGGVRVEDANGVVRLDRIMPELAFVAPDAVLQISIDTLALDRDGRCQVAEGRALTPALVTLGDRYGVDLPVLQLEWLCAGDRLGADLSGRSDMVEFSGRLQLAEGGLEGRVEARTNERDVIAALSFAGFDQMDGSTYELTLPLAEEG